MKLLEQQITLPERYSIQPEDEAARNELALAAVEVKVITTSAENDQAGVVVRETRQYVKNVETARQSITKPLLDAQRYVKVLADDHCAPLLDEIRRIERAAKLFVESENRRVAREEEERQAAYRRAEQARVDAEEKARKATESANTEKQQVKAVKLGQAAVVAQEQVAAVLATPPPTISKSKGQSVKQILKWEVTDINALVKARPDLCKIEPKASAIQAVCIPEMPHLPPGLKLWWDTQVVYAATPGRF